MLVEILVIVIVRCLHPHELRLAGRFRFGSLLLCGFSIVIIIIIIIIIINCLILFHQNILLLILS